MAYVGKYSCGLWSLKSESIEKAVEMAYWSLKSGPVILEVCRGVENCQGPH